MPLAPAPVGALQRLSTFAASLSYDDIPSDVLKMVKCLLLDTLGAALAATTLGAGCREVVEVMRELGGKPQSTILGFGDKVSAPTAAFANGAFAHALNYDPIGSETGHVGVVCLTAPLAAAEAVGGISGRDFLAAATVTAEVTSRITAAQARVSNTATSKFMAGQVFGYFGAAAGAGHVLGLSPVEMRRAFGIALMQTSGTMEVVFGGDPPAKAIYGAFPNYGGVLAALLSKKGLDGEIDALEGTAGLYEMFYDGNYQSSVLTDGLGSEFLLTRTGFKRWPMTSFANPFIEAAAKIRRSGLDASKISRVEVVGHSDIRPWCEPIDERRYPGSSASATNSIPFAVCKALIYGDLSLKDFTPQGLNDTATRTIARCVSYLIDDHINGAIVRVTTNDAQVFEGRIDTSADHTPRSFSHDVLVAKFAECCHYAVNPLSSDHVRRLIELIENLESVNPDGLAEITGIASGVT